MCSHETLSNKPLERTDFAGRSSSALSGCQEPKEARVRHEPSKGFSFELPDGWRRDEHILPVTFFGPAGRVGSAEQTIQLQIGGILAQYHSPESREKFLSEPDATVHRTVVGGKKTPSSCGRPAAVKSP